MTDTGFPVEIIDEADAEVLIFEDAALLRAFEEAEREGREFTDVRVKRRVLEIRDMLRNITSELDLLLAA